MENNEHHASEHPVNEHHAPEEGMIAHAHHPSYGVNIAVWIGLIGLTSITVAVAGINLGSLALSVALIIALIKSMFVVNFFMHVKFDSKIIKLCLGVCIVVFITMFILTFFDLTFRY